MPNPENAQLIFSQFLSLNLKQLAGFSWQEYQRLGRGFVLIDQVRPYAIYVPQAFVAELPDDDPHFMAALDQTQRYDPAGSFCVYFGNLSAVVAESVGVTADWPERVPLAGWLMPAIAPQDCHLDCDRVTQIEGEIPLNLLTLRAPNLLEGIATAFRCWSIQRRS